MASYSRLLSVQVEHSFFSDGVCRVLGFVPTDNTNMAIAQTGMVTRNTVNGIEVFYDETKADALQMHVSLPDEPLSLGFKVITKDPLFWNYTEPSVHKEGSILCFDNRAVDVDTNSRLRLHSGEFVSEADFEKLNSPVLEGVFCLQDHLLTPIFIINILTSENDVRALALEPTDAPKSYYIRFQARQSFWKYYLMGGLAKEDVYVNDRDEHIEFVPEGEASLADNRVAVTFRSKTPLRIQERSKYHFQVRDSHSGGGRVLIRRLPVASAGQISREMIDGEPAFVSEMFINR